MTTFHLNPFRRRESIAITPEELTAAYNEEVRIFTLEVLEELGLLYTMSDEEIDRYYDRTYHYLSFLGVPELYRENPDVFDERLFCRVAQLFESKFR